MEPSQPLDHAALRRQLARVPALSPWTSFEPHDSSLSADENRQLVEAVSEQVTTQLGEILVRLQRQQATREAAGVLSDHAARALLESRLVVEAKRHVDVQLIAENTASAIRASKAMAVSPATIVRSDHGEKAGLGSSAARAWRRGSVVLSIKKPSATQRRQDSASARPCSVDDFHIAADLPTTPSPPSAERDPTVLCVQFAPRDQTLHEALEEEEARQAAADNPDTQATAFLNRPVTSSAVQESSEPAYRREPAGGRVRYIMSTRLGALPPSKRILDEYPIPKEILEALERHRHYHVDDFSLNTSFDTMQLPPEPGSAPSTAVWDAYFKRSVPIERKPVSFVLASLAIAPEQSVPPPSDIFHQHVLASKSDDAALLTEVRQLYDHTHDAYREFRATLHRNLDVSFLVDLSFRSSLNATTFFLDDDDEVTSSEPTVVIPPHLKRVPGAAAAKWKLAKKGTGRRRGAIAMEFKSEGSAVAQRHEMLNKLCAFSALEVRVMELWHGHDPDAAVNQEGFDPIPMSPALSQRFEAVWKELQMPAEERLDLAIKYASLENSSRLADAVVLWEVAATLIHEREELLPLARMAIPTPEKSSAMIATETALLQDLTAATVALKEALVLTYVEVGDFVTLGGNFYLIKMEYEATELRQLLLQSIDSAAKFRHTTKDATMSDGTKIGAQSGARRVVDS